MRHFKEIDTSNISDWFKTKCRRYLPVPLELILAGLRLLFGFLEEKSKNGRQSVNIWRLNQDKQSHKKSDLSNVDKYEIVETDSNTSSESEVSLPDIKGKSAS